MKKNKLLLVLGVATASLLALTGFRHAPHGGGGHGGGHLDKRIERALDQVDATEAQRTQIEAIKARLAAQMEAGKEERSQKRGEFRDFWLQATPDAAQVHAKVDERIEAQRARGHAMADAMLEVHAILTPEQRAKLAELHGMHGKGRGKR